MKLSQMVTPTPEIIQEIKQSYNRILKRCNEASRYLDDPEISQEEKDKRMLTFRIEILNPIESYLQVLKDWEIKITDEEILGGMKIE